MSNYPIAEFKNRVRRAVLDHPCADEERKNLFLMRAALDETFTSVESVKARVRETADAFRNSRTTSAIDDFLSGLGIDDEFVDVWILVAARYPKGVDRHPGAAAQAAKEAFLKDGAIEAKYPRMDEATSTKAFDGLARKIVQR